MNKFLVKGGKPLKGVVPISGAKNAALPIMAASLLVSKGEVVIKRVPDITDVIVMKEILEALGAKVYYNASDGVMIINASGVNKLKAPYNLVKKIHASFDITGPLVARFGEAQVPLPGGCVLGTRAVNFHLDGFKALGGEVQLEHGYIKVSAQSLKGNRFFVGRSSVGATKNIMMVAVFAEGETVLENAAREPEVVDLANFLKCCGAKIKGEGTSTIVIEGVKELSPVEYTIISDRIEAGTYLLAGAITGGEVTVENINPIFLNTFLQKLKEANINVYEGDNYITVSRKGDILPIDIITAPYPGFPTDLHAPMAALLSVASGTSFLEETIFDARFNYVDELRRMGANIKLVDRTAVIRGVKHLCDAPVEVTDLRAGGALIIGALEAEGVSEIGGIHHVKRGYENIIEKFLSLGAEIREISVEEEESELLRR